MKQQAADSNPRKFGIVAAIMAALYKNKNLTI
jgi:hypothetical protein